MATDTSDIKWERVLWKRQPFPDNYVPETFLDSLSTNGKASSNLSIEQRLTSHSQF